MRFQNTPNSHDRYLEIVLGIIRQGIFQKKNKLKNLRREGLKSQELERSFNYFGTSNEKEWIGCSKEFESEESLAREDIYFYIRDDDGETPIFFMECKRLPKPRTRRWSHDYVSGVHTNGTSPNGGIERYKKGLHGQPDRLKDNGIIGYVERETVEKWKNQINTDLAKTYSSDGQLVPRIGFENEFESEHEYDCTKATGLLKMHHFLIEIT